ncbi:beta-lactamase/transpeptidase-like protein [Lophiotrema nucula]|uniref:Beta-lactamase/transpeptidase-like protein n=1 Tax=Lophiotrema nucula TaxID=690887 RepID=A0A6A5Z7E4_9PLEO|nr:beta-lactamase/transpeptidase-like protein [Lophiotrema nucula]
MDKFESILAEAVKQGSNIVPGAVVAVVDKDGNYVYKHVDGFNGVGKNAQPLEFDATYFIASCTKLITSIAALQAVERGLITLDEPLDKIMPEFAALPIASLNGDEVVLTPATNSVTLRHLVTHSSGAVYDIMSPALAAWRASKGEEVGFRTTGIGEEDYAYPRAFEAGESWSYGPGLDWAGLVVARLNKTTFEDYVEENVAKPLGIKSFTWHPFSKKPEVGQKLMKGSSRNDEGVLTDGPTPFWPEPVAEGGTGGAGLYTNVHDYTRVLTDLLKAEPVLLKKETADGLFTPQFAEGSNALAGLLANGEFSYQVTFNNSLESVVLNHGLGGVVLIEDVVREDYFKPKGTLTWSGMPNLLWSVNRERGLALFFATQVAPWGDRKAQALGAAFETEVWRNLSK